MNDNMNNQELVSIIVPVHNVEQYVFACLESLSAQSYTDIEVIMVDDGSTDSSGKICDGFAKKDGRFHVIHTAANGPGSARNTGLEVARGEWISFMDSDDIVHPDYIKYLLYAAKTAETDIVLCKYCEFFDSAKPQFEEIVPVIEIIQSAFAIKELLSGSIHFMVVWAKLFSKRILKDFRFKTMMVEDTDFMARMYPRVVQIACLNSVLYYYYRRNGALSLSPKYRLYMVFAYWGILEYYKEHFPQFSEMAARLCLNTIARSRLLNPQDLDSSNKRIDQIQKASWKIAYPDGVFKRGKAKMWLKLHFPRVSNELGQLYYLIRSFSSSSSK